MWASVTVIGSWMGLALLYILRTPYTAFTHDVYDHVYFLQILFQTHRLPPPLAGWETYNPPLYYAINWLIASRLAHPFFWIRIASVCYGAIVLGLMAWVLMRLGVKAAFVALVLVFIATPPKFLFLFYPFKP